MITTPCAACDQPMSGDHKEIEIDGEAYPVCLSCHEQIKSIVLFGWRGTVEGKRKEKAA